MPASEKSVLIYSLKISSRLVYICELIFKELLGLDIEITNDKETFYREQGAKINYSNEQLKDGLTISPATLLFEENVETQKLLVKDWNGCKIFFLSETNTELPYDPLAAAFYLVSRYEEYLSFEPDDYGRFKAEDSLAYKEGFLHVPVVNHFAIHLKEALHKHFHHLKFVGNQFKFLLTYDIDQAYAYKEKGIIRNAGSLLQSAFKGDLRAMRERVTVLQNKSHDPFDTFNWQFDLHKKYSINPYYFLLLADYTKTDNNINWKNRPFQKLIKKLSEKYSTGIHCSIASNKDDKKLKNEITRLQEITGQNVRTSRQHFLIINFPKTYQHLIAAGICEDYSMGYSSQTGFRAGIAAPFYFYDLKRNEKTALKVFPFAVMDATLFYYLQYNAETAMEQTMGLINEVKKVNGLFILLAHNDLLNDDVSKVGWTDNFEKIISYCKQLQA